MKKRIALVALALSSVGAMAQTFGGAIIDRTYVDLAHEITFIGTAHSAPINGVITRWDLFAKGTGVVALQMWRPIVGGYQLLGENNVTVTSLGAQSFAIPAPNRIAVQAGDVLGFRYRDTFFGPRVIAFQQGGGAFAWTQWPSQTGEVPIGGTLAYPDLVGQGEYREYSVAANVEAVPEPATILAIMAGLGALRARRRH